MGRDRDDDRDERSSRRGRDDDRDERRSSRDRDDDRERSRSRGDDDSRGSRRGRDENDDRGGSRRSGSSSGYEYKARSRESVDQRAANTGDFDSILKRHIKAWKPRDGENRIRILPPTWKPTNHFGLDIYVHYGVGADRQSYLCLHKMKSEPDPINEEREAFVRTMDSESEKDKDYLRELSATKRVLIYLIDRNDEKAGVQAWAMPKGMDTDIVKISVDRDTGEVLPIDSPRDGYDVLFERTGKGKNTKYEGVSIARRSSPLGKDEWLDFAVDNPLPDQLQYFDYDHIARAFGGKASKRHDEDGREDRDQRGSGRDRDDDSRNRRVSDSEDGRGSSRDRDRDEERDFDGRRGRDRDSGRGSSRDKSDDAPELTWESVHDMTKSELRDLVDDRRLKIDPADAKDAEDLADMICEELEIKKRRARASDEDDKPTRRRVEDGDDEKLERMRERRRERD